MDANQGWEASGEMVSNEARSAQKPVGRPSSPLCNLYGAERCRQNPTQDSANNSVD